MTRPIRQEIADLHRALRKLLLHPEATGQDKAAIIQASVNLSGIELRHMGRWTPFDPATLPAGRVHAFAPAPGLPKGHLLEWEEGQGAAS